MNSIPDAPPLALGESPSETEPRLPESGVDWQIALDSLVSSRIGLLKVESKDAISRTSHSLIFLGSAIVAILFAWGFLAAGIILVIHTYNNWPLYWIVLGTGFSHLLVALFFAILAKPSKKPPFSITRAEFQKDREWLHQLIKTKKSND